MLLVVIADKVYLKGSYRAEFKLTRSELFVERSKKTPWLKSASLSTRRFAAYTYLSRSLDEVTLTITREIAPVHAKPTGFTAIRWSQGSTPRKYAAHDTYSSILLVRTLRQTELTKDSIRNGPCDRCSRSLVVHTTALIGQSRVAIGAQQPISDFIGFIKCAMHYPQTENISG